MSSDKAVTRPPLDKREFVAALAMAAMLTAGVPVGESRDRVIWNAADIAVQAADALLGRLREPA
jgi:hypothetical protein